MPAGDGGKRRVRQNIVPGCLEPPDKAASNWIQTVPAKGWFTTYGPLDPWSDQT